MASTNSSNLSREWDLSLYDLHRNPRKVITDDTTEIGVFPKALNADFTCPICLDLLNKTMATKCLHRFCTDCIVTALRAGNKKCPSCRTKIVSKRDLRYDVKFDALISIIYQNRTEFEVHPKQRLDEINQHQSQRNLIKSINDGLKLQTEGRSYKTKNKRSKQETESISSSTSTQSTSSQGGDTVTISTVQINGSKKQKTKGCSSTVKIPNIIECNSKFHGMSLNDMELVIKPHPKEMDSNSLLENDLNKTNPRFIKAPSNATVGHLSKYLITRLNLDHGTELGNNHLNVLIYIEQTANEFVLLDINLTLSILQEKFWNVNKEKPMELYYSYT